MARIRNWDPYVYAAVFHRLDHFKQSAAHVARMTEMSHMQVRAFKEELDGGTLPSNSRMVTPEHFSSVKAALEFSVPKEEPPRPVGRPRKPARPPIDADALNAEVEGCIDLAKQVAAVYGITARNFLHACLTNARSIG
jgi:hypothetical protein